MILKLKPLEKTNIIESNYLKLINNKLCGNYLHCNNADYLWGYVAVKYNYYLYVELDNYILKHKYDFDMTFNWNLCQLYDKLTEALYKN